MKRSKAFKVLPVLASALVLSLVTACGNSGTTKEANGSAAPAATASVSNEPVKVTLWTPMNPNAKAVVKSLNELPMVQEWAKKTNVTFDFQHSSGNTPQDDVQQYGVMVASNNLPDSMLWNWNSVQGGTAKMFKDGTIIKLNDLIEKNARI